MRGIQGKVTSSFVKCNRTTELHVLGVTSTFKSKVTNSLSALPEGGWERGMGGATVGAGEVTRKKPKGKLKPQKHQSVILPSGYLQKQGAGMIDHKSPEQPPGGGHRSRERAGSHLSTFNYSPRQRY